VVALGALISLVLYFVAAAVPRDVPAVAGGEEDGEPAGLRWGRVFATLGGGLVLLGLMVVALSAGVSGPVLLGFFHGAIGAGAAYYLSFLVPERAFTGSWPRVRGLIGAAGGIVAGAWPSAAAIAAAALIVLGALWAVRRVQVAASPETTQELTSGGYIPFGVGLALAAGVLAYTGGAERMRRAFSELAPMLGLG
jgi:hypothetical protein